MRASAHLMRRCEHLSQRYQHDAVLAGLDCRMLRCSPRQHYYTCSTPRHLSFVLHANSAAARVAGPRAVLYSITRTIYSSSDFLNANLPRCTCGTATPGSCCCSCRATAAPSTPWPGTPPTHSCWHPPRTTGPCAYGWRRRRRRGAGARRRRRGRGRCRCCRQGNREWGMGRSPGDCTSRKGRWNGGGWLYIQGSRWIVDLAKAP